ncbi:hypothetical protein K435DRAFT_840403 [Dendrothele bispora CBS 962.96]|uniref:Uncharacterized protein n=1 Tax=Dendrothele bispora (strain CBS 962.96) TaxID=1314807 RepID=A0A4S8LUC3_DENBC|nr:hypothetical protein K435DRAFT_840403 [Dendrothele bispora CBS 962.96]
MPSSSSSSPLSIRSNKTTDFAHLLELFDKLASHGQNANATTSSGPISSFTSKFASETRGESSSLLDNVHSLTVPSDLKPIFRNLASLVGPRTWQARGDKRLLSGEAPTPTLLKTRGRRKTISAGPCTGSSSTDVGGDDVIGRKNDTDAEELEEKEDGDEADAESRVKFGLGRSRPFTFKMMLHKLYELDEWGKKVKEILERSQNEFKPLAEKSKETPKRARAKTVTTFSDVRLPLGTRRTADYLKEAPQVHLGDAVRDKSPTKPPRRPRSHTVSTTIGRSGDAGPRTAPPVVVPQDNREDLRTVKKRCVGRRKSTTGLDESGVASWFYISRPAAVASSETNRRNSGNNTTLALPKLSKYGALQDGPRPTRKMVNRRRVSSAEVPSNSTMMSADGIPTRRRVSSIATSPA